MVGLSATRQSLNAMNNLALKFSLILELKWLCWLMSRVFISAPTHHSDGIIITISWPFLLEKSGIPQAALHLWILFILSRHSLFDVYDVTFIYLPIIRSAYCHRLPYIEASRHHGSPFEFYLFIFDTRHHSRCSLSHAALHWVSTVSRQPVGVLMILYFDTHLRSLWCGINLSAHHSLGISSHAALHRGFTAPWQFVWNLFILFRHLPSLLMMWH